MARVGINPARNRVTAYRPSRVTVTMLVYVPYQEGYFRDRLEVLKLSLASLIRHTDAPYDLMVMDNGSCAEAKAFLTSLQDMGALRYLITAQENIGKIGALKVLFRAAPGEVIAYSDDDIFFYPGWLQEHLRLLDGYPRVGMVSGCAVRTLFDHGTSANLAFAESNREVILTRGQRIPELWEVEWAESYGRDPVAHREALRTMQDMTFSYRGLDAFAIANHNQFVTPKDVVLKYLPETWSGRLMGEMNELDNAVADGGYLRLSTIERTTKHIGNTVSRAMAEEAARLSVETSHVNARSLGLRRPSWRDCLLAWKPVRWLLQGIYNRLFWILSRQSGEWYRPGGDGSQ
jgi:glycosyltransferase involved in cell wall biosynthesis